MNRLDPGLRRLLQWAHRAPPSKAEDAPFGFAGRVLAARKPVPASTIFEELQRAALGLSCVAAALIVCGAIVLRSEQSSPPPTEEVSSALNFLASNLAR